MSNNSTVSERVARLEEGMADLDRAVVSIKKQLDTIADSINRGNRPQWSLYVSAGALLVMTIGGLWTIGIGPLREGEESTRQLSSRNTDRIQAIETHAARNESAVLEKLAEIETQFHESRNIKNLMFQNQYQLLNLTRREMKLDPIDFPTFWPLSTKGMK